MTTAVAVRYGWKSGPHNRETYARVTLLVPLLECVVTNHVTTAEASQAMANTDPNNEPDHGKQAPGMICLPPKRGRRVEQNRGHIPLCQC
jgi:hypothetical protein